MAVFANASGGSRNHPRRAHELAQIFFCAAHRAFPPPADFCVTAGIFKAARPLAARILGLIFWS